MSDAYVHTVALMGTVVTIHVVGRPGDDRTAREAAAGRAIAWFREVERTCNRFDPESELSRLSARVGEPVAASELLCEAVRFALAVADETDGAFDPTVGLPMERRGFNRDYRSGTVVSTAIADASDATYRDVAVDAERGTVTLGRPLLLDLGAVAKGLAIDMAARELASFEHYAIDAGGDLYLAGHNAGSEPWSVGIRHPRDARDMIETIRISGAAVCTSGDYERLGPARDGQPAHHILDPRTGESAHALASVTVVAPSAMVADAFGTAAFVLGSDRGLDLLERQGVDGLLFTSSLERRATHRWDARYGLEPGH